jgi:hypothetical protein
MGILRRLILVGAVRLRLRIGGDSGIAPHAPAAGGRGQPADL